MTLNYHPLDKKKMLDIAQYIQEDKHFTVLEFGVAIGNTMCAMLDALIQINKIPQHVYGFDSFKGLPEEDPSATQNPEWFPGAFNIVDELNNNGVEATITEGVQIVANRLNQYPFDIKLIVGWYSDLTSKIAEKIWPANYIHIDCDMYSSAIQALTWLADNQLIANGCMVRYDDWKDNVTVGEHKAHLEICAKYGYRTELIKSQYQANTMFRFYK